MIENDSKSDKKNFLKNMIGGAIDTVFDVFENGVIELDADVIERENKKRVYLSIANFVKNKFNSNLDLSLAAVYVLCHEEDKQLLKENPRSSEVEQLAEKLQEFIVAVKVHYEMLNMSHYQCEIEIYFLQNDKPSLTRISEKITRDDLPQAMREHFLKTEDKKSNIKLFP